VEETKKLAKKVKALNKAVSGRGLGRQALQHASHGLQYIHLADSCWSARSRCLAPLHPPNPQVRNYEVYRLLEEALKAMLTSLPLVQVGKVPC
jgi:hypothetical protein